MTRGQTNSIIGFPKNTLATDSSSIDYPSVKVIRSVILKDLWPFNDHSPLLVITTG